MASLDYSFVQNSQCGGQWLLLWLYKMPVSDTAFSRTARVVASGCTKQFVGITHLDYRSH
jgi:hypothetical protein